jgi:hypothetical protein
MLLAGTGRGITKTRSLGVLRGGREVNPEGAQAVEAALLGDIARISDLI